MHGCKCVSILSPDEIFRFLAHAEEAQVVYIRQRRDLQGVEVLHECKLQCLWIVTDIAVKLGQRFVERIASHFAFIHE
jgi:hypothetical protein